MVKKNKTLTIKIHRKDLYLFIAIFVFLIGTGAIIAYGGNNSATLGHSASEVNGTIVGACTYTCDYGLSIFYQCTDGGNTWGAGVCTGGWNGVAGTCSQVQPTYKHCVCTKGQLVWVGTYYTRSESSYENYKLAAQNSFLCIT